MRNKIFISHANPEDIDQARWIGLQLMTLGYEVWCDVINLKGGEKFWKEIENEIRNNTCKFLYVLTKYSNQREGCLNELSVAEATEKVTGDNRFIVSLHFDSDLTYDNVNINLKRKIDLNFKTDWQQGLKDLLSIFEDEPKVPMKENPDFDLIHNYWNAIYLNNRKPIEKEETYSSNWFEFTKFPDNLYIHNFKGMIPRGFQWNNMPYPTYGYKRCTATFGSCYSFVEQLPKTKAYDQNNSRIYKTLSILNDGYEDDFISNRTLLNIINNLISTGFVNSMKQRDILSYDMSGKVAFCFPKDINKEKTFSYGQLVGKLKERNWHFAFSGFPDLLHNVFVLQSHILLSEDGSLLSSKKTQQAGRRRQGANWWNKHWKHKLLSSVSNLVDTDGILKIEVGDNSFVLVSGIPVSFKSAVSYVDPDEAKEALDDFPEEESDEVVEVTNVADE
jgi:hypothetical protein